MYINKCTTHSARIVILPIVYVQCELGASSMRELRDSLAERGVELEVTHSSTLHDREIR